MKNIFYAKWIGEIGGIETFFYNIARKYQDYDITIYYEFGNPDQIRRLQKYIRVKKYNGEKIKCDKAFFNYHLDIINNIEAKEYIQIVHGCYKKINLPASVNKKITKYLSVSKVAGKDFEELTGNKTEIIYNPILIDKPKKVLNLISATRLTVEKGKDRIIKFAKILEENNIPYLWTIFTNDTNAIKNPNIIYMKPRLDIIDHIANNDYLVQLSDSEAYCYSVVEALCVGTPVIVTECPVFKEIGVENSKNGFIVDFDMNNIPIKEIYKGLSKFEYKPKQDTWDKYLVKGESEYKKDLKTIVKVKCIKDYDDILLRRHITTRDDLYEVNKIRAEILVENNVAKIVDE